MDDFSGEVLNADTVKAIEEVRRLKTNPNKKTYDSFAEILDEMNNN